MKTILAKIAVAFVLAVVGVWLYATEPAPAIFLLACAASSLWSPTGEGQ